MKNTYQILDEAINNAYEISLNLTNGEKQKLLKKAIKENNTTMQYLLINDDGLQAIEAIRDVASYELNNIY